MPNFPFNPSPQHVMESSSRMAQKWYSPAVMDFAVRPLPRLMAEAGGLLMSAFVPPLPNCPCESSPQHLTEPSSSKAQTVVKAMASDTAVRPEPSEPMVVGVLVLLVEPIPSCPSELWPQHLVEPSSRMAQVL